MRARFTFPEALVAYLKMLVATRLEAGMSADGRLALHVLEPRRDETAHPERGGVMRIQPRGIPARDLLAYVIRLAFEYRIGPPIEDVVAGQGWEEFLVSWLVRDRIPHPKSTRDAEARWADVEPLVCNGERLRRVPQRVLDDDNACSISKPARCIERACSRDDSLGGHVLPGDRVVCHDRLEARL